MGRSTCPRRRPRGRGGGSGRRRRRLRQLWKDVGFKSRSVRLAIASARVIVRTVDMPLMSDGDTRAALELPARRLHPDGARGHRLRLPAPRRSERPRTATASSCWPRRPRDAVRPLVEAVRQAGLRVEHVDVAASALARLVRRSRPMRRWRREAIVSIGAGTIVVRRRCATASRSSARTITNVSGRHVTDRIATELSIPGAEAERLKRHVPDARVGRRGRRRAARDRSVRHRDQRGDRRLARLLRRPARRSRRSTP